MSKLTEIDVQHSNARILSAKIAADGAFSFIGHEVMESQDIGDPDSRYAGDVDYRRTVPADYKDTMLLWLVKERFATDSEFDAWLDAKGIPSEFQNVG